MYDVNNYDLKDTDVASLKQSGHGWLGHILISLTPHHKYLGKLKPMLLPDHSPTRSRST